MHMDRYTYKPTGTIWPILC